MIRVLGARCLVEEEKMEEETKSGLVIPGRSKESTFVGKVIAVGNGAMLDNGESVPMQVNVGDRVTYTSFSGSPITDDKTKKSFLVLNERDILAILD